MNEERRDYRSEILRFVETYIEENGYPPTYEEIREAMGLKSKSQVDFYLDSLETASLIERKARTPRSLRLLTPSRGAFELKVAGTISAGQPVAWAEGREPTIVVTSDIADPKRDLFALEVKGDSMIDALVGDGDIVIVEPACEVRTGQVAVVHLTDRNVTTLKGVRREGNTVRLQPQHSGYEHIVVHAGDVEIQGRVVAVVRRLN
jgi:repressor LexA